MIFRNLFRRILLHENTENIARQMNEKFFISVERNRNLSIR